MLRSRKRQLLLVLSAAAALLGVVAIRLPGTVEFRLLTGAASSRAELCRSLPELAAWRQDWALKRLLRDPSPLVRSSAITAVERGAWCDQAMNLLLGLATAPGEDRVVRAKAGSYLLAKRYEPYLAYLADRIADPSFRERYPVISARYLFLDIEDAAEPRLRQLVSMGLDPAEPAHREITEAIKNHAVRFQGMKGWLLEQLERAGSLRQRRLVLHLLQAVEGQMRGVSAADWQLEAMAEHASFGGHVLEAEWATEIQPNYQIGDHEGVRCLMLGEGAGGLIHWLKAYNGTVDIGSARLSFLAPATGQYQVWARVYLDDKCGNSFGFHLGNRQLANFPDALNVLGEWHWLPLMLDESPNIPLAKGFHQIRLEAWEDAVYVDKFALLPTGVDPEAFTNATAEYWDPASLAGISFSFDQQSQTRGTRQQVTIWIRRDSPAMQEGSLTLTIPNGFKLLSPNPTFVSFADGNPLARSTFELELPADGPVGEGMLQAVYRENGHASAEALVEGEFVLGGQFDWLTTGPLAPDSALHQKLQHRPTIDDAALTSDWSRYPANGYDRYRRLNPEYAWGPLANTYMYFCTDIEVATTGTYTAMLTADDTAKIWIDGELLIQQPEGGPGEGRMVTQQVPLTAGRHRLLVQLFQAPFSDPSGPEAKRKTANNCCLKLLLRQSRHVPAPQIKGLMMSTYIDTTAP